jgi:ribosomal protein S18 acetylase RimI-like enzyme
MDQSKAAFLNLTLENLQSEHICCAISGGQHQDGVERKKEFLARALEQGLVFRKLEVRGKVFIEYAPAEVAWRPVVAPGYLVIHCFWVSGRYKGQGLGRDLLQHCIDDAKDRQGVVSVTGRKPYLTDTRFYLRQGFELVEQTNTGFDLVCYRRNRQANLPRFAESARRGTVSQREGVHFEYVHQCPFVPGCLRDMADVARELNLVVSTRHLNTIEKAQSAASPFGTFGAFLYGDFITHELMSPRKFRDLIRRKLQNRQ